MHLKAPSMGCSGISRFRQSGLSTLTSWSMFSGFPGQGSNGISIFHQAVFKPRTLEFSAYWQRNGQIHGARPAVD